MTPADIRKLARQNEVGGTAIDQRTADALRALADVVEAAITTKVRLPNGGPLIDALDRLEVLKP